MYELGIAVLAAIVSAAILGIVALARKKIRDRKLEPLVQVRGDLVAHMNNGEMRENHPQEWIAACESLYERTTQAAAKYSSTAEALVHPLGWVPQHNPADPIDHHLALLMGRIQRLTDILRME